MQHLVTRWWNDEPARFFAALVIFINSVIAFAVELQWLTLEGTGVSLLYLVVVNGFVLIGGEAVRNRVSPTGKEPRDPDGV